MKSTIYNYTVYFQPIPEGGYNVVVPAMPEVCTFGKTLKEAKENALEAITCVLESAYKNKERIPQESKALDFIKRKIQVFLPV